jgi:cysteine synthase
MRKTILTVLGATLIAATTVQMAAASEHHARKTFRAPVPASQQFHNANNSAIWSAQPGGYSSAGPGGYNTGR